MMVTEALSELIPPCGLYCGVCRIYQATQEDDMALLRRLARVYSRRFAEMAPATAEGLLCDGCLSGKRSVFCHECSIRDCVQKKGFAGCHECLDFPCSYIDEFAVPVGKKVILRAIPYWRAHGTEQWVRAEAERYRCPECEELLFRGARECRYCGSKVDLDSD
jgi:hypothetical protein